MNIELFDEVLGKHANTRKSLGTLETLVSTLPSVSEQAKTQLSFMIDVFCYFTVVSTDDCLGLHRDGYSLSIYDNGVVDYNEHKNTSYELYFKNNVCAVTTAGEVVAIVPKCICTDAFWEKLNKAEVSKNYD